MADGLDEWLFQGDLKALAQKENEGDLSGTSHPQ
jgi:hypothetical protein